MNEERLDWLGNPCWFCGRAPPVEGSSATIQVRKMVGPGEILSSTVSVPRCDPCRDAHRWVNTIALGVAFAGLGAFIAITMIWDPLEAPIWGDILAGVLAMGPGGMLYGRGLGLPEGIRPEVSGATYTAVLLMVKNGWYLDDTEMNQAARDAIRVEIEGRMAGREDS